MTCHQSDGIYKTRAKSSFLSLSPNLIIEESYLQTFLHSLAAILDLYGRMPVGLLLSKQNDKFLVLEALKTMLITGHGKEGSILHSDRGSTYCSEAYQKAIKQAGMICSMSRKGNCWDNAPMESFWGKMKTEWLFAQYDTIEEPLMTYLQKKFHIALFKAEDDLPSDIIAG